MLPSLLHPKLSVDADRMLNNPRRDAALATGLLLLAPVCREDEPPAVRSLVIVPVLSDVNVLARELPSTAKASSSSS